MSTARPKVVEGAEALIGLAGRAPLMRLDTTEGSRQVEALLGRIDHGLGA